MPDDRPGSTPVVLPQENIPPEKPPGLIQRWRQRLSFKSGERLRADLEEVLEEDDSRSAPFSEEERTMLRSILELREHRAVDLALPRTDIISVQKEITLGDLIATFEDCGHTRLIVHDDSLDDPVGMVHIKDVLGYLTAQARIKGVRRRKGIDLRKMDLGLVDLSVHLSAIKLIRPVLFVPPSMPALDLLQRMQASRIQLALVIDEYGGTDGLVAIKDIVETIVGDIEDEHDEDQGSPIVAQADGRFIADARASIEELAERYLGERFQAGRRDRQRYRHTRAVISPCWQAMCRCAVR